MTSPCRGSARSARCLMPMTAMADQGHSDGLTALRDRDLDDLDRHCSDPDILSEKRIGYMVGDRSEEHTSELQSLMRISYAVFCLKKKNQKKHMHMTQKYRHQS